jgi:hypothetical protein
MIKDIVVIKVNENSQGKVISVRVQLLDVHDMAILETTLPVSLFLTDENIRVGKRVKLICSQ